MATSTTTAKTPCAGDPAVRKPEASCLQAKAYNRGQKSKVTYVNGNNANSNHNNNSESDEEDDLVMSTTLEWEDSRVASDFKRLLGSQGLAELRKLAESSGALDEATEKGKCLRQAFLQASSEVANGASCGSSSSSLTSTANFNELFVVNFVQRQISDDLGFCMDMIYEGRPLETYFEAMLRI